MFKKTMLLNGLITAAFLLAACAPTAKTPDAMMKTEPTGTMMPKSTDAMMQPTGTMMQPTEEMMGAGMATPTAGATDAMMQPTDVMMSPTDAMMSPTDAMAGTPAAAMDQPIPSTGMSDAMSAMWVKQDLSDPGMGKMFKIDDFKGKVVLVETFAQWCTTSLAQQQEVVKLHQMMGMNSDLVTVSLDTDPKEDATMLKTYLDKNGYDWYFAVAPREVAQEIGKLYGNQFLTPTAAPMLIIDRKGEAHLLPAGVKTSTDLQKALDPFLKAGM